MWINQCMRFVAIFFLCSGLCLIYFLQYTTIGSRRDSSSSARINIGFENVRQRRTLFILLLPVSSSDVIRRRFSGNSALKFGDVSSILQASTLRTRGFTTG